eukprot:6868021-Prymnesium_polylepis.1
MASDSAAALCSATLWLTEAATEEVTLVTSTSTPWETECERAVGTDAGSALHDPTAVDPEAGSTSLNAFARMSTSRR